MNEYSVELTYAVALGVDDARIDRLVDELEEHAGVVAVGSRTLSTRISVESESAVSALTDAVQVAQVAFTSTMISFEGPSDPIEVDLTTAERLDERLAEPPEEYVGATELAELLGVSRQRASSLATSSTFPPPVARLASGPVWPKSSVSRFIDVWDRKPGRPRKDRIPTPSGVQRIRDRQAAAVERLSRSSDQPTGD